MPVLPKDYQREVWENAGVIKTPRVQATIMPQAPIHTGGTSFPTDIQSKYMGSVAGTTARSTA